MFISCNVEPRVLEVREGEPLLLSALQSAFPFPCAGLTVREEGASTKRSVHFDGTAFHPPDGSWRNFSQYEVVLGGGRTSFPVEGYAAACKQLEQTARTIQQLMSSQSSGMSNGINETDAPQQPPSSPRDRRGSFRKCIGHKIKLLTVELENVRNSSNTKIQQLHETLVEVQRELKTTAEKYEKLRADYERLAEENRKKEHEVGELRAQLDAVRSELAEHREQAARQAEASHELQERLCKENIALAEWSKKLEMENKEHERELEGVRSDFEKRIQSMSDDFELQHNQLQQKHDEKCEQTAAMHQLVDGLNKKLVETSQKYKDLEQSVVKLRLPNGHSDDEKTHKNPHHNNNVSHLNAHNGTANAHAVPNGQPGFYFMPTAGSFQYSPDIPNPTVYLNPGATISRRNHDGRSFVDVQPPAQPNYGPGVAYPVQGYPQQYIPQQMSQHYQQQYMVDSSQQYGMYQPQPNGYYGMPPMGNGPKKKNILKIVDPNTKEEVKLDARTASDDASAPSKEVAPKEEKPEDDAKQRFAKAIATRAIDSPEKPTPQPSQPQKEAAAPAEPPAAPTAPAAAAPEPVAAATPEVPSKQTTPSVDEEKPPTSASAPPPSVAPPAEPAQPASAPKAKASSLEPSLLSESNTVAEESATASELNTTPSTPVAPSETPTPDHTNHVQDEDFSQLEEEATRIFAAEEENIEKRTYSFSVLDIFHKIVKEFKKSQPPPEQMKLLRDLGLDIQGDPPQQHQPRPKYASSNSFTPSWQPAGNPNIIGRQKQPYAARKSENGPRRKQLPPRNSMDRTQLRPPVVPPEPLRTSENAWKPKRREDKGPVDETEKKYELARKNIRSILNKVTPNTYEELAQDFYALNVETDERLQTIAIDLIFEKAVEEPKFCPLYTNICKGQVERGGRKTGSFFRAMISKCQSTFEGTSAFADQMKELEEKLAAETDEKKKPDLQERIELLKAKEKRCLVGNVKLISHLFTANLLSDGVVSSCIYVLQTLYKESNDDIYIQYAIELLELVADIYFQPEAKKRREGSGRLDNVDPFIRWVPTIKDQVSTKVKVLIMNFEDFVRAGYKKRNVDTGPKKTAEIHNDAKKEEEKNLHEREVYNAEKAKEQRPRGGPPNRPYVGRASLETKNRAEAMTKAANASSGVGNTTNRPSNSLRTVLNTDARLGSNKTKPSFFSTMVAEGGSPAPAPLNSLAAPAVNTDHTHSGESDGGGGGWEVAGAKKGPVNANNSRKPSRERH
ncbi:MIF4G domain-containing protein [Aphelenchoides fujianensis]|nr:MIF4G domain-containing protein [Aphelenchoides fujianensis]